MYLSYLCLFLSTASAFNPSFSQHNAPHPQSQNQIYSSQLIHQYPNPTWLENIATTSYNSILVTHLTGATLSLIDPSLPNTTTTIHNFTSSLGLLGITEPQPDKFYLIAGNFSTTIGIQPHSFSIQSVDLSAYNPISNTGASVQQVVILSEAGLLNGLATLSSDQNLIIASDSTKGVIWWINTVTGTYNLLLNVTETQPPDNSGTTIGVNGLKVLSPYTETPDIAYVYFTNTGKSLFARVPVSLKTLTATAPVQVLDDTFGADDFAIDEEGEAIYLAYGNGNQILKTGLEGRNAQTVLGGVNETVMVGPTSVAVGRGKEGRGKIYVSTEGGLGGMGPGGFVEGGKVVEIEIGL